MDRESHNQMRINTMNAAVALLKLEHKEKIECPECKQGQFGGIFSFSCSNPDCILHNAFDEACCGICRQARKFCCC